MSPDQSWAAERSGADLVGCFRTRRFRTMQAYLDLSVDLRSTSLRFKERCKFTRKDRPPVKMPGKRDRNDNGPLQYTPIGLKRTSMPLSADAGQ